VDELRAMRETYAGGSKQVRSLRRKPNAVETSCWFHTDNFGLSRTKAVS
jgi:hypothetical protein